MTERRDEPPADLERAALQETMRRQSDLRLDREGRFWHQGTRIRHERTIEALHAGVDRHAESGEYIVRLGREWAYLKVDDAPLSVRGVDTRDGRSWLRLSDGTTEPFDPHALSIGDDDVLYALVRGGGMEARFSRIAQQALLPHLALDGAGRATLECGGVTHVLPHRRAAKPR